MGLSRELQQVRVRESDPSRGGSRGYNIDDRLWMLEQAAQGRAQQNVTLEEGMAQIILSRLPPITVLERFS
jgi:hypothetical protein